MFSVNIRALLHWLYSFYYIHLNDFFNKPFIYILISLEYIKFNLHIDFVYEIIFILLFKHLCLRSFWQLALGWCFVYIPAVCVCGKCLSNVTGRQHHVFNKYMNKISFKIVTKWFIIIFFHVIKFQYCFGPQRLVFTVCSSVTVFRFTAPRLEESLSVYRVSLRLYAST